MYIYIYIYVYISVFENKTWYRGVGVRPISVTQRTPLQCFHSPKKYNAGYERRVATLSVLGWARVGRCTRTVQYLLHRTSTPAHSRPRSTTVYAATHPRLTPLFPLWGDLAIFGPTDFQGFGGPANGYIPRSTNIFFGRCLYLC